MTDLSPSSCIADVVVRLRGKGGWLHHEITFFAAFPGASLVRWQSYFPSGQPDGAPLDVSLVAFRNTLLRAKGGR